MKRQLFLFWMLIMSVHASAQTASAKLSDYVGVYKFSENFQKLTIEEKDGTLFGELDSYGKYKYNPKDTPDTFQSTSSYGTVFVFRRDPKTNTVVGVTIKLMGQEVSGEKMK